MLVKTGFRREERVSTRKAWNLRDSLCAVAVNWRMIAAFVRRDIRARYINSVLGLSWAIVHPLFLLALYAFVFVHVLRLRPIHGGTALDFTLYLFCGMLPWLAFAEAITRAAPAILMHAHLIKKMVFPVEILPVYVVVSALLAEIVALVFFLVALAIVRGLAWTTALIPLLMLLQFLFTVGLAWALATLTVFLRDVAQILGLALTAWMFLTPIFYPAELVPQGFRWILYLNPMFYLIEGYRNILLNHHVPSWRVLAPLAAAALGSYLIGHWVFWRSKGAFVDVL